jgi:hypothetical protein
MKVQERIRKLVDKLPAIIKKNLEDPDMPRCVSHGKDRAIDGVWPDVREEILWEVAVFLDEDKNADDSQKAGSVVCIRAWLRYHIYPYDLTIWAKLRDPAWLVFMASLSFP